MQKRIVEGKVNRKQQFLKAIRLARDRGHISKSAYYELRNGLEES